MSLVIAGVEIEFADREQYKEAHAALAEVELSVYEDLERIAEGKGYNKAERQAYLESTLGSGEYMYGEMPALFRK